MLRFKHTDRESERVEEWPDGRRVTDRTSETVRDIGLDWEFLKGLPSLSPRQVADALLRELAPRVGLFLLLRELLETAGSLP